MNQAHTSWARGSGASRERQWNVEMRDVQTILTPQSKDLVKVSDGINACQSADDELPGRETI